MCVWLPAGPTRQPSSFSASQRRGVHRSKTMRHAASCWKRWEAPLVRGTFGERHYWRGTFGERHIWWEAPLVRGTFGERHLWREAPVTRHLWRGHTPTKKQPSYFWHTHTHTHTHTRARTRGLLTLGRVCYLLWWSALHRWPKAVSQNAAQLCQMTYAMTFEREGLSYANIYPKINCCTGPLSPHTPTAVTYHEQLHYCTVMIGYSLGRMAMSYFLTKFPFIWSSLASHVCSSVHIP